jgi:hypothetical protein
MRLRDIAFFGLVGIMIELGLFVNSVFFLLGMGTLCGGHMILGHGKEHETRSHDDDKTKSGCH